MKKIALLWMDGQNDRFKIEYPFKMNGYNYLVLGVLFTNAFPRLY